MSMIVETFASVKCDKCEEQFDGEANVSVRNIRAHAKSEGWKLGRKADFCPSCSAQISEAIKLAQAGEIK